MEFDVPILFLRTMFANIVYLWLCILISNGVYGVDGDEVKSVSVMEGDSVTLDPNITEIETDDQIMWMFVSQDTSETLHVAEFVEKKGFVYDDDKRFRNKLNFDNQNGSLTITNLSIKHSGVYKVQINSKTPSYKTFNVTVYDHIWPSNTPLIVYVSLAVGVAVLLAVGVRWSRLRQPIHEETSPILSNP
ncbi:uncharacterized protein [Paramisgurnus dabryanus]|uniref:uncharacterized protein isoform X2 n=1 Tax=Paramisgurnus dabryanus TaxID=90735 RepID=UPI003CCF60BA